MGLLSNIKRLLVEEKQEEHTSDVPAPEEFAEQEPQHLTGDEFTTTIQNGVVLVDFWAEWCVPCHAIAPAIAELARNYGEQAVIAKLNVDDYPQVASQLGIMGIPTVIIFKEGQEFKRFVGVQPYDRLASALEQALGA